MPKGLPTLAVQPWPKKGWEYLDLELAYDGSWADALNERGRDGWKAIAIIHDETPSSEDKVVRIVMMRPLDKDWRAADERAVRVVKQRAKKAASSVVDETEDE